MGLTYFSGQPTDVDRALTPDEVVELQSLLGEYYTSIIQADPALAPSFRSFNSTIIGTPTYTPASTGTPPSIAFPFNSTVVFSPDTTVTSAQILQKMVDGNYETFINNFLKRDPPNNQLDRVQRVAFNGTLAS
jgi:hypothetical protein